MAGTSDCSPCRITLAGRVYSAITSCGEAASWFYRINAKKGEMENLNSPSAEFRPYSEVGKQFGEHAHGWHALVSELSMLAMGAESQNQMEG